MKTCFASLFACRASGTSRTFVRRGPVHWCFGLMLFLGSLAGARAGSDSPMVYTSASAFTAAAAGSQIYTVEVPPVNSNDLNIPEVVGDASYQSNALNIPIGGYNGSSVPYFKVGTPCTVTLSGGHQAVAMYLAFDGSSAGVSLSVNNGTPQTYTIAGSGSYSFLGVIGSASSPITTLTFQGGGQLLVFIGAGVTATPTITTPTSTALTTTSATLGGNVTASPTTVTACGVVYALDSANSNPQLGGSGVTNITGTPGTGAFTANATGLTAGTAYAYAAYATNAGGTTYTSVGTFTTPAVDAVTIYTSKASYDAARLGVNDFTLLAGEPPAVGTPSRYTSVATFGDVTYVSNDNLVLTALGSGYYLSSISLDVNLTGNHPAVSFNLTNENRVADITIVVNRGPVQIVSSVPVSPATQFIGIISPVPITGLIINPGGQHLDMVFPLLPQFDTPASANVTGNTATLSANLISDGGTTLTARGVVYAIASQNPNPLLNGTGVASATSSSSGLGALSVNVSSLNPLTTYAFATYVTNSSGTYYSPVNTFTTGAGPSLPTVTGPTIANLTSHTVTLGGNVTSDGGASLTKVGVLYAYTGDSPSPKFNVPAVNDVPATAATGVFTVNLTGLSPDSDYSYVAYAVNSAGTTYTTAGRFVTLPLPPTITSPTSASITGSTASLGGNVTADNGGTVTARGVVYAPASANATLQLGSPGVTAATGTGTTGVFTVTVAGLSPSTTYSYAAYATNSGGTNYTTTGTFTTGSTLFYTTSGDLTTALAGAPVYALPTVAPYPPAGHELVLTAGSTYKMGDATYGTAAAFRFTEAFNLYSNGYFLRAGNGQFAISLTGNHKAVSFSLGAAGSATSISVTVNGGTAQSFPIPVNRSGLLFLGLVDTGVITSISISVTGELDIVYPPFLPIVSGQQALGVGATTATITANMSADGGAPVIAQGLVYSATNHTPTINGTDVTNVTNVTTSAFDAFTQAFSADLTGLTTGTTYYFAGYTTTAIGTSYTSVGTFLTTPPPVIGGTLNASGTYGTAITAYAISASNTPTRYSATGLPPGLALNTTTGQITGTPTDTSGSPYTVALSATNAGGTGTANLSFTINKATLAINGVTAASKIYDGTTTATLSGGTLGGVANGDSLTLVSSGASGTFANANVGTNKPVTVTGYSVTGAKLANYTYTQPAGLTASITAAPVAITITNLNQVYDGTPKRPTVSVSPNVAYTTTTTPNVIQTDAGPYSFTVTVTDPNYTGTATQTLVIAKAVQTISFVAPGNARVNTPVTLNATASSGLPITYSVVSGHVTISGNALTLLDNAGGVVRATQAGTNNYAAATADVTVTASGGLKQAQTITVSPLADQPATAGTLTVSATASSGLPVTITVVSGPAQLSGNTLTLTGAAGTVVLKASQAGDGTYLAAQDVTVSFGVSTSTYYINTSGDVVFAADVTAGSGTIIGYLPGTGQAFVVTFQTNSDGTFTVPAITYSDDSSTSGIDGRRTPQAQAATPSALTFQGKVSNGVLSGKIVELNLSFSVGAQPTTGPSASVAGLYQAAATNATSGTTYTIVGTQGQVFALTVGPGRVAAGTGTVTATGAFTVQGTENTTIAGTIDAPTTTMTGTVTVAGQPAASFAGLATTTTRTDRLINLSSRAQVGGAGGATLVTGFVIGGSAPKQVLLRAIGPGLAGFGIPDALSNPGLTLYNNTGAVVAKNTGWIAADAATMNRVGAFPLTVGSTDSDLVTTLAPGAYTMQVTGGSTTGAAGIALAEIYDASANAQAEYQRLVNISSRGTVSGGNGVLVGGFVITGNSPKTVLVRGVGPSLAGFGVTGVLADPKLTIYSGSTVIAQNDDWGTPVALSATQAAATATQIASAALATGAFALPSGSKDAAVIVTLAPGAYTAQVSAAGTATGTALVEIYEMPNN